MNRNPTLSYVAPFAIFVGFLGLDRLISLPAEWFYPIRLLAVAAVLFTISLPYWSLRASMPLASIGVGVAVFLIWIAPDVLFGAAIGTSGFLRIRSLERPKAHWLRGLR